MMSHPDEARTAARNTDPEASHIAAGDTRMRASSDRAKLLRMFRTQQQIWTDHEAAKAAGLTDKPHNCWWKRTSELRQLGLIEWVRRDNGRIVTKIGEAGRPRGLSQITALGLSAQAFEIARSETGWQQNYTKSKAK